MSMEKKLLKLIKQKEILQEETIKIENNIKNIENAQKYIVENKIKDSDPLETIILKVYLKLNSVKKAADFINEAGHRIQTSTTRIIKERKYISTDISNIIMSETLEVDKELQNLAKIIYIMNYDTMQNIWM